MKTIYKDAETGCCPRFDPTPWEEKQVIWKDKLFIKDHVTSFFHIPLNFGAVMVRNMEKITNAGALAPAPLMLSDETSLWGADIYIAVSRVVPGARNVTISGTFLTKVFEGPFTQIGTWVKEMKTFVASQGRVMKKILFYYTMCPSCAKHYGKNYVVLVSQIT